MDLMRTAAKAWIAWEDYFQHDPPQLERLPELDVPSVLLIGDLDRPSLIESNVEAARRIPGCRLVQLPGVDHFLPLQAPGAIIDAIRSLA